ncbi:MAG: sodium-dependent bicarbonate transport family permease [Woeseiaceae bacterium]|nr:sodium-dependent bicarbonate transport family permease [Woeseiaceae bacterium]
MNLDPVIWFFALGIIAGLAKSDLRIPPAIYDLLSMLLLLTIGLKGGVELANSSFAGLAPQILAVLAMGFVFPLLLFPIARVGARFARADAASLAAHYGSVSVATFAVGVSFLAERDISYDSQLPLFVVLLEVPAIIVGIMLARQLHLGGRVGKLMHEIFLGKSIVLLIGGLLIGWAAGPVGIQGIAPLFFDLFKGVLALFLLEMGLIAARQARVLRECGLYVAAFGLLVPVPLAIIGTFVGWSIGLSPGGTTLLAVLAGSASYIAAPAAIRVAVPEANPSISLTASLGVTFPFNVFVGVPLYYAFANMLHKGLG